MKNFAIILSLLIGFSLQSEAQANNGFRQGMIQEKIEAQRVAFITQRLNLTPTESALFWPLYNEFKQRQKEVKQANRPFSRMEDISEAEAEQILQSQLDQQQKLLDLRREYFEKLKSAIPAKKIIRLSHFEQAFNREILNRLRDRGGSRN
jgi:hypothetical protein